MINDIKKLIAALLFGAFVSSAHAGMNKCIINGHTKYQQAPCPANSDKKTIGGAMSAYGFAASKSVNTSPSTFYSSHTSRRTVRRQRTNLSSDLRLKQYEKHLKAMQKTTISMKRKKMAKQLKKKYGAKAFGKVGNETGYRVNRSDGGRDYIWMTDDGHIGQRNRY